MTVPFGTSASLTGTIENRPTPDPNQIGRIYLATNEGRGVLYRDNGSSWDRVIDRPYRVYSALLTQTGTNAPVATVLENTLGFTPVWSRNSQGDYRITEMNGFPINKTQCFYGNRVYDIEKVIFGPDPGNNMIELFIYDDVGVQDDLLLNFPIEIRVYP
jgi:hypothetical protein